MGAFCNVGALCIMLIKSQKDFWSGVMFIAIGLFFAWFATDYQMGTAARMGPGYFPFWLGIIIAVLGALIGIGGLRRSTPEDKVGKFDFRVNILVLGSAVLFGLLLRPLGLYASLFVLVVVSSLASHEFGWKVTLANAVFLILFSYFAFIRGLGLIFPLYPWFIG